MLFDDTYQTIEKPAEGIFSDRGSKFIAYACPLSSESRIKAIITKLKGEHPRANHHCWAMRLGTDRSVSRINDDGEPPGTAGRPILNTLLSHNLTNILVVVVRYFGGTLLGVPGLINAYKTAVEQALRQAVIIRKTVNDVYTLSFNYLLMNDVMRIIKDDGLTMISQQFDNDCSIQVAVRKTQVEQTLNKLGKVAGIKAQYNYSM